jgi:hypothetical protein
MYECDFVEKVCEVVCPGEKYVKLHKVYKLVEEKFKCTNSVIALLEEAKRAVGVPGGCSYPGWCTCLHCRISDFIDKQRR